MRPLLDRETLEDSQPSLALMACSEQLLQKLSEWISAADPRDRPSASIPQDMAKSQSKRDVRRALLLLVWLGLVTSQTSWAATLTARWIGNSNGSWNTPANWDTGKIPNNTGADIYDVIWDAAPITMSLDQPV